MRAIAPVYQLSVTWPCNALLVQVPDTTHYRKPRRRELGDPSETGLKRRALDADETTRMTSDQREVLDFLAREWRIRLVQRVWLLKESGQISSYADLPGGEPTLRQLRELGYIDGRNMVTELGRAASLGCCSTEVRTR